MKVPFLDLGRAYGELSQPIDAALLRVARGGQYIGGHEVDAFEEEWARFVGCSHCVGTGNGLDALTLGLRAIGIGAGDEVIVPAHTFIATWLAVSNCGATPRPVEPDPITANMDPLRIEAAITSRTRAIVVVHIYGQPVELDAILAIARRHGLPLVEDAAQAHGARFRDRPVGSWGHFAAWSFYPTKNLGALGDAGAVTTNDEQLAGRIRKLGNYGSSRKYVHDQQGFNSRLDPLQAAVLRIKLSQLLAWNQRRKLLADRYSQQLSTLTSLKLPQVPSHMDPVWHLYTVRHAHRDALQQKLAELGVETLIHYPTPSNRQPAYALLFNRHEFPVTQALTQQILSLPMGPHLDAEQACYVIDAMRAAVEPHH